VKKKQPFAIAMKDGQPHALAGLWERWKNRKSGGELLTFTVITIDPNEVVRPLHYGMPVISQSATTIDGSKRIQIGRRLICCDHSMRTR
jgi:putative SOS response-associated peptidase YedK